MNKKQNMIEKHGTTILIAATSSVLSCLLTLAFVNWFSLPPASRVPIDMLTFTESAFGISMTVIALVVALIMVNYIKEIEAHFNKMESLFNDFMRGSIGKWRTRLPYLHKEQDTAKDKTSDKTS